MIRSPEDLDAELAMFEPGQKIRLLLRRGEEQRELALQVAEVPGGYLGFAVRPLSELESLDVGLPPDLTSGGDPAVVSWVQQDTPLSRVRGFGENAVIIALNGEPVRWVEDFRRKADEVRLGDEILIRYYREGRYRDLSIVAQAPPRWWSGLRLEELSPLLIDTESLSPAEVEEGGLFVRRVEADSPGEKAGLRRGDRIVALDGAAVSRLDEFEQKYAALAHGVSVPLGVRRSGGSRETLILQRGAQLGATRERPETVTPFSFALTPRRSRGGRLWVAPLDGPTMRIGQVPFLLPIPLIWTKVTGPVFTGRTSFHWASGEYAAGSVVASPRAGSIATVSWDYSYGTSDARWYHSANLDLRAPGLPSVSYVDRPRPFHREQISNLPETWFLSAFFGEDLLRYVDIQGWAVTWEAMDRPSPGHDVALGFEFYREEPVENSSTKSLFGRRAFSQNPFDEIDAGRSHTATLTYSFDRICWRSWTRNLVTAEVRVAGGVLGGDQEFVRWEGNATRAVRLLRRLYADARLRAGAATGSLPFQEEFAAGGKGTLPGYRDHEFSGDRTVLLQSRVSWVPFAQPEQPVQYRLFVGLDAGNAWRVDDVPSIPRLRTSFAFGHGVYIPARFWIPFPVGISTSWAVPLDDDRGWRFHLDVLGGAPR